jgi:hypothetical protein
MIFVNTVHLNSGGMYGFYDKAVTIRFRTRKRVQKFVKYVNNFGHVAACICWLAS